MCSPGATDARVQPRLAQACPRGSIHSKESEKPRAHAKGIAGHECICAMDSDSVGRRDGALRGLAGPGAHVAGEGAHGCLPFGGDRNVSCLDGGDGGLGAVLCPKSPNCPLKVSAFDCM